MAVGESVTDKERIIRSMRGRPVIVEGSRNDDCVNLAILAWVDHGPFEGPVDLRDGILREIDELMLDGDSVDHEYLSEKCSTLMDYLPGWASENVYDYALA